MQKTVQTANNKVQKIYAPASFTPLIRIETDNAELVKTYHLSLAEKLQQDGNGVVFPAILVQMLDRLEDELRRNAVSDASRQ